MGSTNSHPKALGRRPGTHLTKWMHTQWGPGAQLRLLAFQLLPPDRVSVSWVPVWAGMLLSSAPGPHAGLVCCSNEPTRALLPSKVGPLWAACSPWTLQVACLTYKFRQTVGNAYPIACVCKHTHTCTYSEHRPSTALGLFSSGTQTRAHEGRMHTACE